MFKRIFAASQKIIAVVRKYADSEFNEISEKYFGDNYNPHITISESSSNFDRDSGILIGIRDTIDGYHLAKKSEGSWVKVMGFCSE